MEDQFIKVASLLGDPTRAVIMWALLDGKAFTATELAIAANTSPQNISMHLAKLLDAGLLCVEKQGRHKYYRFSNKEVAYAIEAMASLIPPVMLQKKNSEKHSPIKHCRTCYDHLAGKIGVAVAESLVEQSILLDSETKLEVTLKGIKWFSDFGINIEEIKKQRRLFLKPCLDWSERKNHIAGSLGASLLNKMIADDWLRRTKDSRAIQITGKGEKELFRYFKIVV
ncbi:winged helix-turn-helix domain-containing protein [Flavobacterium sp. Fl-318]|uniref:Winged helix-turn-helix domain-containing protein n=1 Tax=Flavobacterium cupriresistens TaxID=2893885 RepID=A0ABU4RCM4_9FLAO|nr:MULTISPECIES: winged helix-turn-helix domain-containing protein [unclassified Flavobacterium]MDX6190016.1 winged helix-turn-helix domain-containing protein [Flavobacterium sp. Fl-318]UFH42840.1 winged helix-turn-helix domain-containing protein [Flavobacterium sp. F-323]